MKAKKLILAGSSWRVGDGLCINIKNENWLLDEGHRRIISPLPDSPSTAKVAELIHGSPSVWNSVQIRQLFLSYDSEVILRIPLSTRSPPDKLIWYETRDGKYSVRTGYKLLLKESRVNRPRSSQSLDPDPI